MRTPKSERAGHLRHFTCTQALEHGSPERHVQVALGHSAKTMERYQHCQFKGAVKAVQRVEDVLDDGSVDDVSEAESGSQEHHARAPRGAKRNTRWPKPRKGGKRSE